MLKKIAFSILGVMFLSTTSNAYYDDYEYKKHIKKGYQFGFNFGFDQNTYYHDKILISGVDSKFIHEFGRSGFNAGLTAGIFYNNKHTKDTKPYNIQISGRVGSDRLYKGLNMFAGYGVEGYSGLEKTFYEVGSDFYYSEDVIISIGYKRFSEEVGNKNKTNQIGLKVIIPFNHY